jgi:dUTP pyrophosphatase
MKLKIKKLDPSATIPSYAKGGDACFDLTATSIDVTNDKYVEYGTGLAMEIPEGYVGLIFPRSSVTNKDLMLKNSVGVIDSGYRGEIKFRFLRTKEPKSNGILGSGYSSWNHPGVYTIGERIGQMMILPYPTVEFEEVDELTETNRGEGGYGSTGK